VVVSVSGQNIAQTATTAQGFIARTAPGEYEVGFSLTVRR
jgi:hypothetical protein